MIEILGFETPEKAIMGEVESEGIIITVCGKGMNRIQNISIYMKDHQKGDETEDE